MCRKLRIFVIYVSIFFFPYMQNRICKLVVAHPPAEDYEDANEDLLSYPYFNVQYKYDKRDWSRMLLEQSKTIATRQEISALKRRMINNKRVKDTILEGGNNLLFDTKAMLFQKALTDVVKNPTDQANGGGQSAMKPHYEQQSIYSDDFVNISQPQYRETLVIQAMGL